MVTSVFSAIGAYLHDVYLAIRSVTGSCLTALPYLFSAGELRKEVTEQYPDPISAKTPDDLPPRTRGLLENDISKCTGCKDCEKTCPTGCIRVENEQGPDASKTWVAVFDIDLSRCISCGLCVEVCQPQSLKHSRKYEKAVYELPQATVSFGRGHVTEEQRSKWATLRQQQENEELRL